MCQAIRAAVGDDYRIMLDSTWSYDYPDALRVGRAIEELDFYWYEDPLAYDDIYSYVKLKQVLATPQSTVTVHDIGVWCNLPTHHIL